MPGRGVEDFESRGSVKVDPAHAWRAVFEGEWKVVERACHGAHQVVVCARPPKASPITARVLELAQRRAKGVAVKKLAIETGRSSSSVSLLLTRFKAKLKLGNDAELVALFGNGRTVARVPCKPPDLEASVEGSGRHARLFLRSSRPKWACPRFLSAAEREVVLDLVAGVSRQTIARTRGRSRRTVSNQIAAAFRKCGVTSCIELFVALRGAERRVRGSGRGRVQAAARAATPKSSAKRGRGRA